MKLRSKEKEELIEQVSDVRFPNFLKHIVKLIKSKCTYCTSLLDVMCVTS